MSKRRAVALLIVAAISGVCRAAEPTTGERKIDAITDADTLKTMAKHFYRIAAEQKERADSAERRIKELELVIV